MERSYETARVEDRSGGLLLLTLSRPEVANAMNTQMGLDLLELFDGFCAAPNQQRCIVITGAGRGIGKGVAPEPARGGRAATASRTPSTATDWPPRRTCACRRSPAQPARL